MAAQALYEDLYCVRGEMENRIKEQQLGPTAPAAPVVLDHRVPDPARHAKTVWTLTAQSLADMWNLLLLLRSPAGAGKPSHPAAGSTRIGAHEGPALPLVRN